MSACAAGASSSVSSCEGDRRLEAIRFALKAEPCFFHEPFLHACLPWIYGLTQWPKHSERVLKGAPLHQEVMAVSPSSRWNGNDAIGRFCAVLLRHVPNLRIAVLTTGKRAARAQMDRAYQVLYDAGRHHLVTRRTTEALHLSNGSRVTCVPAGMSTLRGFSGDVVMMQSAHFWSPGTFYQVILPLCHTTNCTLLAITEPDVDETNYYTTLRDLKTHSGEPLFHVC